MRTSYHLPPRSQARQRAWIIGEGDSSFVGKGLTDLRLDVVPDSHETFVSFRHVLAQLEPFAKPKERAQITILESYLQEACPERGEQAWETRYRLLTDSIAFAMMRRISRESGYTARIIDLGARTINAILANISTCQNVHVPYLDRLDRPTLKIFARAMLLLTAEHGFGWVWHSATDPVASPAGDPRDLYRESRTEFLSKLLSIVAPRLVRRGPGTPLYRPDPERTPLSIYEVSAALIMQNYDACFLWCDSLLSRDDPTTIADALRIKALAAVNVGRKEDALHMLEQAERISTSPAWRAHLCYLQGLLEAKRNYNLARSASLYSRGLAYLDGSRDETQDLPLERAWLLNGLAMNEAVRWRKDPANIGHFHAAFNLLQEAFELIRDGDEAARTYLRFNLLSNSGFLMEMQGDYGLAVDILRRTFDFLIEHQGTEEPRWRSTLGYRLGVLYHRAGNMEMAFQLLSEAAAEDPARENWSTQEHILRALGSVSFEGGDFARAAKFFTKGLEICQAARAAEGTYEHARGLIAAVAMTGERQEARKLLDSLPTGEGFGPEGWEKDALSALKFERCPVTPRPKPPQYVPEVDLEDIPALDVTRFLSGAVPQDLTDTGIWTT